MNWKMILSLAGLGVLLAIATIFGWLPSTYWTAIGLIVVIAALLGYTVKQKLFMHGFWTAVIWSLIGGALQFVFWDQYIANNPDVAEKVSKVPEGTDIRPWMAIGIVFGAAIYGVILGLLAMLFGKLLGEKPAPEATETPVAEQHDTTGQ